jgi:hypothetical protein
MLDNAKYLLLVLRFNGVFQGLLNGRHVFFLPLGLHDMKLAGDLLSEIVDAHMFLNQWIL